MTRPIRSVIGALAVLVIAGCSSSASHSDPSEVASPTATTGTVEGVIPTGRILVGIEQFSSHASVALAFLDDTGYHELPASNDPTQAHACWASKTSIVFDSERDVNRQLFWQDLDDGTVKQLTKGADTGSELPSVSTDGSQYVYDHYDVNTNQDLGLWTAVIGSSGGPSQVTPKGDPKGVSGATDGDISPDGRAFAFVRIPDWNGKEAAIFVKDGITGTERRLTPDSFDATNPRFSPDGKLILFNRGDHGGQTDGRLWVVPVKGGKPLPLTDASGSGWDFEGDWSPDGQYIVYKHFEDGWDYNELRIALADGSDEQVVFTTESGLAIETPDWGT